MSDGKRISLSVIVPAFNVENYLGRCLDSLLASDGIENTEIIIVDDGSTDSSGSIADSYSGRYDFIKSCHRTNGGLSAARNYGLAKASGKYVFFCDSDDRVLPEGFEKVLKFVENSDADVVLWDGTCAGDDDRTVTFYDIILNHDGVESGKEVSGTDAMVRQVKDHGKIAMTCWLRAVRREYLLNNKILFEEGLIHEDELWTPLVMTGASKVVYLQVKAYCYCIRKGSIISSSTDDRNRHSSAVKRIMDSLYDLYSSRIEDPKAKAVLLDNWAGTYMWFIKTYEIRSDIPKRRILSASGSVRNTIKALMLFAG